jgi:hypothetical protein
VRDDDITTALQGLTWLNGLFMDGLYEDQNARGNRGMHSVPYIELQAAVDLGEHDSSTRLRKASMTGRVVYIRGHHKPLVFRNDLEALFLDTDYNIAQFQIEPPSRFTARLDQMPFSLSYWESAAKT